MLASVWVSEASTYPHHSAQTAYFKAHNIMIEPIESGQMSRPLTR